MRTLNAADKDCRLVKGQVFLWEGARGWEDLWDLDGRIAGSGGGGVGGAGSVGGIGNAAGNTGSAVGSAGCAVGSAGNSGSGGSAP
jgi:hypothetical protein